MKIKIFWKNDCPNCPSAKELGKKLEDDGVKVEYFSLDDAAGLAEGVMYDVMATPSIICCDDKNKEVESFRSEVPSLDEIKNKLS
ncbi:thioredoxin family protein [Candidatus Woesearchaeota archaeon]|nr:thioredoxin family protein [Candidatus Woesearchaeota archaeon]